MDLQTLKLAYDVLPPLAQSACAKAGAAVVSKLTGAAWNAIAHKTPGAVFAGIYRQWQDSLVAAQADDANLAAAFEDFFSRQPTIDELCKLLRDQYRDVDFAILEEQLRESCDWAHCPVPRGDLHATLYAWVRDLHTLLEDAPEFRREFDLSLQHAIRELSQYEAVILNDSAALQQYLASVIKQHRYVRFAGMAEVSGPDEVEMSRVFVMPRVIERSESRTASKPEPKPAPASKLLTARKAPRRAVILGGPGSGKTTLLESFCLTLAQDPASAFTPIFYRIRDLDHDLETHRTIWDAIRHDCSRKMGLNLPPDFLPRQMERRPAHAAVRRPR